MSISLISLETALEIEMIVKKNKNSTMEQSVTQESHDWIDMGEKNNKKQDEPKRLSTPKHVILHDLSVHPYYMLFLLFLKICLRYFGNSKPDHIWNFGCVCPQLPHRLLWGDALSICQLQLHLNH